MLLSQVRALLPEQARRTLDRFEGPSLVFVTGRAHADELGESVMYRHLDVTDVDGWETIVAQAEEAWGPVKVLVNNAGIVTFGTIDALSPSNWQRTIDINLTGVFLGMHAVVPSMKQANGGAIVNIPYGRPAGLRQPGLIDGGTVIGQVVQMPDDSPSPSDCVGPCATLRHGNHHSTAHRVGVDHDRSTLG